MSQFVHVNPDVERTWFVTGRLDEARGQVLLAWRCLSRFYN